MSKSLTVSVVVPVYNEEKNIGLIIEMLLSQKRVPDEIIIVDDGSTDKSVAIVKKYRDKRIKLIEMGHEGVNTARDKGTIESQSDIVIQTDADCIPPADWIYKIILQFEKDENLVGLTGNVKDYKKRTFENITTIFANKFFPGMGTTTAYRRDAYFKTTGYNRDIPIHMGGDVEFWTRLNKVGRCLHDDSVIIKHNSGYKWKIVGLLISGGIILFGLTFFGYFILLYLNS
ncbi:MAG TPA: glycosyltransferase [Halobacteria archaeon]|nr:glycosyltransferase [Halobacteria archaeon]